MHNATLVKLSDPMEHGAAKRTRTSKISAVEQVEPVKTPMQHKLPGNRMNGTGPTRSIPSYSIERASRQVVVLERVLLTSNDPRTGAAIGTSKKRSLPRFPIDRASRQAALLERVLLKSKDPRRVVAKGKGEKARAYAPDEIEPTQASSHVAGHNPVCGLP